jgi:presenilin-like A22 family membrane protease
MLEAFMEQVMPLLSNPTIVMLIGVFLGIFITVGIKAHKIHYIIIALVVAFGLIYLFNVAGGAA